MGRFRFSDIGSPPTANRLRETAAEALALRAPLSQEASSDPAQIVGIPIVSVGTPSDPALDHPGTLPSRVAMESHASDETGLSFSEPAWELALPGRGRVLPGTPSPKESFTAPREPSSSAEHAVARSPLSLNGASNFSPSDEEYIEVDESDLEPFDVALDDLMVDVLEEDPLPSPTQKSAPRPSVAPSASARVVMVVEDDDSIREMLTRSLGGEYCVYEAPDGVAALDMLSRMSAPDLLLLDVGMPRMDGLALAGRVRADARMKLVPIIFLSGLDEPCDVVNGINAGARQYMTKPFKMKELLRRVDRAINQRSP